MASRKEQKEQLRREREEREAAAKAAERRRRLIGYGAGGALAAVVVVVLVVLLAGGGDGDGKAGDASNVLPDGGSVPEQRITDLDEAAKAAGCELESAKAKSRDHTEDLQERIDYDTNPPTSGRHFAAAAEDGAYEEPPDVKELVHSLEHGRVIIWFKESLPEEQRANLKALFDDDSYQMILTPGPARMPYEVAATAWNAEPEPLGTGRLLGCREMRPEAFDALRAFREEHRSNGPEPIP